MGRAFLNTGAVDWEDLRHFAAFVHGRSLSAAAKRLGVDHVTIARRMAALEAALGVKLVDRRARIPVLTAEGERIAGVVAQLEQAADAVSRTARGLVPDRGELTGEVAISAPPTIANALIAPRLAGLHVRHPKLRLRLLGEKRIASLARREADVALRLTRPTEAGLVTRKVGAFEFALYGARSYLAGRRRAELALIAFDEDGDALPQQKWLLAHAAGRPIALRTNDLESQLAAACAGAGVAVLPSFLVRRHPELERVALRARPVTREVWLVVHDDLRAVASVRAVMELLIEATAELRGR